MAYLNNVSLIGNLGKDAQVRMTTNGRKCVTMTLATSRKYRDAQGNQKDETNWHNIVIWGKLADTMESMHLTKGTALYVGGTLTYRKWEKNGNTQYITEIVADAVQILSKREGQSQPNPYHTEGNSQQVEYDDTDIPF